MAIPSRENGDQPTSEWIRFWLAACRSPELLLELVARFPRERQVLDAQKFSKRVCRRSAAEYHRLDEFTAERPPN